MRGKITIKKYSIAYIYIINLYVFAQLEVIVKAASVKNYNRRAMRNVLVVILKKDVL